jgi:hypothetical protein
MKVPAVFQGKKCQCGSVINDGWVREIGIDFNEEQFILRFTCEVCGFKGKVKFRTKNQKVEDLCREIADMSEASGSSETFLDNDVATSVNTKIKKSSRSMEEVFSSNFEQNNREMKSNLIFNILY